MPSTRKQKAKKRRSRQFDMMSDAKNVDIMLGSYSKEDERNEQSENELNLDSGSSRPQQNSNLTGIDFRSLLNSNTRENSEITTETTRIFGDETASHVTRKLNDIRSSLKLRIQEAINTAFTERLLPSIENSLVARGRSNITMEDQRTNGLQDGPKAPNFTMVDHRSSGLQRNSEVVNPQKTKENRSKMGLSRVNQREMSRASSVDSYTSEQNRDTKHFQN